MKAAEEDEQGLKGRLGLGNVPIETLEGFAGRMAAMLDKVPALLRDAAADSAQDPVLLAHEAATGTAVPRSAGKVGQR